MGFQLRVTVQVVNDDGDVVNTRGHASHLNKDGRLEATRTMVGQFASVSDAHNALNLTWGFFTPIESALFRNKK